MRIFEWNIPEQFKKVRYCDNYLPAGWCDDDKGNSTCLAKIGAARVFDCFIERDNKENR